MDFSEQSFPRIRQADFKELSPSIHWAQLHKTLKHQDYPPRRIYDFELLYLMEGRITAHLADKNYDLASGNLLYIGAGVRHHLTVESGHAVFLGIHFDYFDELDIQYDMDIIADDKNIRTGDFCSEAALHGKEPFSKAPVLTHAPDTVKDMERLIEQFNSDLPGASTLCKGIMLKILVELFRFQNDRGYRFFRQSRIRVAPVVEWIEAHFREDCSNPRLASIMNVHEDYMTKLFKSAYGITPNRYVQMVRHREAKRKLKETDATVEQIGNSVGYEDLHYFSRVFSKWEGMSPREYRNSAQMY